MNYSVFLSSKKFEHCTFFNSFLASFKKNEWFAHSLFFKERCKWIIQVAHDKRATVSKLLRSLTKNEQPWVICSDHSQKMSNLERITQVAHQKLANDWIAGFLLRELLICLFFSEKPSIHSENRWANFQPRVKLKNECWNCTGFWSPTSLCSALHYASFKIYENSHCVIL